MYDIKNLTNEVQYLFFRSGKECFLAGNDGVQGIRDSEITPVINKMRDRKIISLVEVKAARQSSVKKSESLAEREMDTQEKGKGKATGRGKK